MEDIDLLPFVLNLAGAQELTLHSTYVDQAKNNFDCPSSCPILFTVFAVLYWQSCAGSPSPDRQSCFWLYCACSPVLAVLSCMRSSGCPVLLVPFWMSYSGSLFSGGRVLVLCSGCLFWLSILAVCPGCLVLTVLSRLFSPDCPVLAVLFRLSCPGCLIVSAVPICHSFWLLF
jgi:hypothetical protein